MSTPLPELTARQREFMAPYLPPRASQSATLPPGNEAPKFPRKTNPDVLRLERPSVWTSVSRVSSRPFVTLTYATGLDGAIAADRYVQTALSGPESKSMTHYLRTQHDAIMVGPSTAQIDNPGLNSRYPGVTLDRQPIPIILDPGCAFPIEDSEVYRRYIREQGKRPIVVCRPERVPHFSDGMPCEFLGIQDTANYPRNRDGESERRIDWAAILGALGDIGIRSIMIEGGASVITGLLARPWLVDSLIVTVAPKYMGKAGPRVSPTTQRTPIGTAVIPPVISQPTWQQFGDDMVLCSVLDQHPECYGPPP